MLDFTLPLMKRGLLGTWELLDSCRNCTLFFVISKGYHFLLAISWFLLEPGRSVRYLQL